MVVKRQCSFCAAEIEPGTGTMFVKRDGTVYHFCSSSCRKQQLHLGRVGHRFKWTRAHALKVSADRAAPAKSAEPVPVAPARRARRPVSKAEPVAPPAPSPSALPPSPAPPVSEPAAPPAPEPATAAPAAAASTKEAKPKRPRPRKKPASSTPPSDAKTENPPSR